PISSHSRALSVALCAGFVLDCFKGGSLTEPPEEKPGKSSGADVQWGRFIGMGAQLTVTVVLFVFAGRWADRNWGWAPWGERGLGLLGIVIGLYWFVKDATR